MIWPRLGSSCLLWAQSLFQDVEQVMIARIAGQLPKHCTGKVVLNEVIHLELKGFRVIVCNENSLCFAVQVGNKCLGMKITGIAGIGFVILNDIRVIKNTIFPGSTWDPC